MSHHEFEENTLTAHGSLTGRRRTAQFSQRDDDGRTSPKPGAGRISPARRSEVVTGTGVKHVRGSPITGDVECRKGE